MSKIVVDEDTGKEEIVFTAEELEAAKKAEAERIQSEYEAKLAEKDEHLKKKTDEFVQGKTAQELKDQERDAKTAEALRIAEEANKKAEEAENKRISSLKKLAREQYAGNDPTLAAKFDEAWDLVNLEIKEDEDIFKRAELTANLAGLNSNGGSFAGGMPFAGGFAPKPQQKEVQVKEEEHSKFKNALGLEDFIPKPEEK